MPIRTKLFLSFLLLTILILVQFFIRYQFTTKESRLVRQMVAEHQISNLLSELAEAAQKIRRFEKEYFIYVQNAEKRSTYYQEFQQAKREILDHLQVLRNIYSASNNLKQLSELAVWQQAAQLYTEAFETVHQDVLAGNITGVIQANAAIREGKNRFRVLLAGARRSVNEQLLRAQQEADQIDVYRQRSTLIFTLVTAASLVIGLFIAFSVPGSIARPMRRLSEIADGISRGRIKDSVNVKGSREIEDLARSIERLRVATQGLLMRLKAARNAGGEPKQ